MRFIFLAAGKGKRIFSKIKKNKSLIIVNKLPLIKLLINEVKKTNINKISIVVGYRSSYIKRIFLNDKSIKFVQNKKYNSAEMLYSLILGIKKYNTDLIISYSDILFNKSIIKNLIEKKNKNITIPILKNWKKIWKIRNKDPFDDGETLFIDKSNNLKSIGEKISNSNKIKYQFMGIIYVPKIQRKKILKAYKKISIRTKMHTTNFLNYLISRKFVIKTTIVPKGWYEFDDYEDYQNFKKYYKK